MDNDNEEIVEGEEVEETLEETEAEPETKAEEVKEVRPTETLEAREARLERQLEQTRKKLGKDVSIPETKPSKKSDEFGYDVKAYLKTEGINASEFDFVKKELKQSGLKDIDSLLTNDYFKSRLETHRNLTKTAEAIPTGKRSGGIPTDDVEYWSTKPIEEVPANMRIKVVNRRLEKEGNKGTFYNS